MTHRKHLLQPTNLSMPRSNHSVVFVAVFVLVVMAGLMGPLSASASGVTNPGGGVTNPGGGVTNPGGGITNPGCSGEGALTNPLGDTCTLADLLGKILDAMVAIGTVVVTIMLVYCGFLFVVAQGNEEKIRSARSALLWTVIGALVLLGAKVLSGVITATVNSL